MEVKLKAGQFYGKTSHALSANGFRIDGAVHSDPLFLSSPQIKDVMLEFMKGQKPSSTHITLEPVKFAPLNPQKPN